MKVTQSIGNIKVTVDDNRPNAERIKNPIKISVNGVSTIIGCVNKINCKPQRKFKQHSPFSKNNKTETNYFPFNIDEALPTSRDDDFILVRNFFIDNFDDEFIWNEDTVYEFIGEKYNLYDEKAFEKFYQITKHPNMNKKFWTRFYNCKM